MATTKKVRFTGERTGRTRMSVYPYGPITKGDVIEVPAEVADRWTALQPTRIAGTVEDLQESWTVDQLRVIARDHNLDESGKKAELAARIHEYDPHIAPSKQLSDFEDAGDAEATVSRFADRDADDPAVGTEPLISVAPDEPATTIGTEESATTTTGDTSNG